MKTFVLCAAVTACLLGGISAWGQQDFTGQTVDEVRIQGLERITEQLVRSQMEVEAGQRFNSRAIARDIRRLYETGYFSNIAVEGDIEAGRLVLVYHVEEKRFITEIRIVGNDRVRQRHIRAVLSWREGDTFAQEAYQEEREAILSMYRGRGYPNATVDITVEEIGPSRVRITYNINEGGRARIRRIQFEGNEALSNRQLRKAMETRRSWWFIGGRYDEDQFEDDLENVVDQYSDVGRLEAQIEATEFEFSEKGNRMDITVVVDEGPEYQVDTVRIAGNIAYDDDEILELLGVQPGYVHNQGQVRRDSQLIQRGYEDSGYINAQATPQVTLDRDAKTTNVVHDIQEGELKYIREIRITGNEITRDDVIRREVLSFPGERFDGSLLRGSQRRLEALDYFDAVRMTVDSPFDDDRYSNLLIDVEEGRTGYFNFGAGYSTEDRFGGFTELRFENFDIANWPTFSGGGQQMRLRLHLGERRQQYFLGFTDPEIFGYPLAFGFDLFNEEHSFRGGTNYTEGRTGGQLRFMKMLSPFVSARTTTRYSDISISGLPWGAGWTYPREYWEQREGSTTISQSFGITRNTLDSPHDTTTGSRHELTLELAGFGGDNHFYKIQHDSNWFWPFGEDNQYVLSFRTREGWVNSYGSSEYVPIPERFFLGGTTTVRGYRNRDIGPQARGFFGLGRRVRMGGELMSVQNLELKYTLTDQVRLYSFVDGGGVWSSASDFDFGDMKFSAGLGFGVQVPRLGPIRIDYGVPLNPDDEQGSGRLHLQTGFRF